MTLHPLVKVDMIPIGTIWHLRLELERESVLCRLGSSSSMPKKPRISSVVNLTRRLILNLEHGRWRWSIIIFRETETVRLVTWILPCIGSLDS
ncbi:nonstructural protein NSs [Mojui dos Campos virus]|uniref:Non-structural protein NS-S n=1 Tax=Mojui dos Campos virus TaxID=1543245 RepID=A0A088MFE7_9VIRU|nr:nonstructural protein NSs [Mojui dos Campos virus]